MSLFDDYVMRQVRKIAELIAAIGTRASGATTEDLDEALLEAYRSAIGMEPAMAERFTPETLAAMLGNEERVRAFAALLMAHGDLYAAKGDPNGALTKWEAALAVLAHADDGDLRSEIESRLRGG